MPKVFLGPYFYISIFLLVMLPALCLCLGLIYLIYKTVVIFGFGFTCLGILPIIFNNLLSNLVGSIVMYNEDDIYYKPNKFHKILFILVSLAIGSYLYSIISNQSFSSYDFTFGISYLILVTTMPMFISIFILIRDRNDFIIIYQDSLKYNYSCKTGEFKISNIDTVRLDMWMIFGMRTGIISGISIMSNSVGCLLRIRNLNFIDLLKVYDGILSKLQRNKKGNELDEVKLSQPSQA
jgi:hypothetical protein